MRQIPKTELSPDNGCVIDTKWKLGNLSYHASAAGKDAGPPVTENIRLPELVVYDHTGFKGAYARTNLSFHFIGNFWNDRISSLIVVSGSGDFIATNITRAIIGISARAITNRFLPPKVRMTWSAPFRRSP